VAWPQTCFIHLRTRDLRGAAPFTSASTKNKEVRTEWEKGTKNISSCKAPWIDSNVVYVSHVSVCLSLCGFVLTWRPWHHRGMVFEDLESMFVQLDRTFSVAVSSGGSQLTRTIDDVRRPASETYYYYYYYYSKIMSLETRTHSCVLSLFLTSIHVPPFT